MAVFNPPHSHSRPHPILIPSTLLFAGDDNDKPKGDLGGGGGDKPKPRPPAPIGGNGLCGTAWRAKAGSRH